ncbi:MAG: transcriptional regulator [Nitrospira sp.]|nr:transcriptional regulator [Nitrospira sp.]MBS0154396.1 transcriptional regulator [Nitrospira sp.]MBS0166984.1 transcriptional regulator [Nitrospira sp.]
MPTYEYQCDSCLHRFEVKQSIKDDPLSVCERCGKTVRRLISSPGIMFKGSGWYVTDYSDKLKPPSSGGSETPSAKTDEKKDSTAPAATTTTTPASSPAPASGSTGSSTSTSSS